MLFKVVYYKYLCKDGYTHIGKGFLPKNEWVELTYKHGGIIGKWVWGTFKNY